MTATRHLRGLTFLSCLLLVTACATGRQSRQKTLLLSTEGGGISITISPDQARSALEAALGTRLDCDGELDPDMAAVLETLRTKGRSGRVTRQSEDTRLVARRRGRTLRLQIADRHGGGLIEATMPWAVAECLLGRSMTLAEALDHGRQTIRVKITGENGESFEVALD